MKKFSFTFLLGVLGLTLITNISHAAAPSLSLSLRSTDSSNLEVGKTYTLDILIDTAGNSIDGIDIRFLRYNPSIVEIIDDNPNADGIQITPGSLMALTLANAVDPTKGEIYFSQVSNTGTTFISSKGREVLATIHFKVISAGQAEFKFDFTPGNTRDTNIAAYGGKDILGETIGAKYYIPGATKNSDRGLKFTRNLWLGSRGEDVKRLQSFLIDRGFLLPGYDTGYYGPLTQAAVKRFQAAEGIVSYGSPNTTGYGVVGPHTRSVLNSVRFPTASTGTASTYSKSGFYRNLKVGMRGEDVLNLQIFLNSQGFLVAKSGPGSPGNETQYFGPATRRALIRFQEAYGKDILVPAGLAAGTGFFGPLTIKKIREIQKSNTPRGSTDSTDTKKDIEQQVKLLQQQIQQLQEKINALKSQL